jgi:TolA-binding protein
MNRLAIMLVDMDKFTEAVDTLEALAARYPGNPMNVWFRLGELYERRLNNPAKAKESYGKVPKESPQFTEAQKRFNRIK